MVQRLAADRKGQRWGRSSVKESSSSRRSGEKWLRTWWTMLAYSAWYSGNMVAYPSTISRSVSTQHSPDEAQVVAGTSS